MDIAVIQGGHDVAAGNHQHGNAVDDRRDQGHDREQEKSVYGNPVLHNQGMKILSPSRIVRERIFPA